MEFSSSSSGDGSNSESSTERLSDLPQRKNNSLVTASVKGQNARNLAVDTSMELRTNLQPNSYRAKHGNTNTQDLKNHERRTSDYLSLIKDTKPSVTTRTENTQSRSDVHSKPIQQQNSTNLLLQEPDLPGLNSQLGLSVNTDGQFVSLAAPAVDLTVGDSSVKSTTVVVEHTAEFVDSQKVINDLEEQNSKLVEEKTKLTVQLGVQTKVCKKNLINKEYCLC